jgi:hypothetical protein
MVFSCRKIGHLRSPIFPTRRADRQFPAKSADTVAAVTKYVSCLPSCFPKALYDRQQITLSFGAEGRTIAESLGRVRQTASFALLIFADET